MSDNLKARSKWWGWGSEQVRFSLQEKPGVGIYLQEKFKKKVNFSIQNSWNIQEVKIPPSRLSSDLLQILQEILGVENVSVAHKDRVSHASGKSYKDLIRLRSLCLEQAPDAILYPGSEQDVSKIFEFCKNHRWALIPFGGGSNVVGSLEPLLGRQQGVLVLNMSRLNRVGEVDALSGTVTAECGIFGPDLENQLAQQGWTLGHFPQSFEFSTLGGWIAMKSSGQNSILYGGVERWIASIKLVTPAGTIETVDVPRDAAGPDLRQILIGSEGIFGVIVSAKIRVTPVPQQKEYFLYGFKNFASATNAARLLTRSKLPVAMIRVSDGEETEAFFKLGTHPGIKARVTHWFLKCVGFRLGTFSAVMVGLEGSESQCQRLRVQVETLFSENGGFALGSGPGKRWLKDRFFLPYLRDEFLDHQILIETFETAVPWSRLMALHEAVVQKIQRLSVQEGAPAIIFAHLSHFYSDGASVYFTVIAPQIPGREIHQWDVLKQGVNEVIKDHGGAASHHHGIGVEHRGYCWATPVEHSLLKSMKNNLDPDGICNPGKLL